MRIAALTAAALWVATGAPAFAQQNAVQFDYLETTTSRTLEPRQFMGNYSLDSGSIPDGAPLNDFSLNYGVTDDLTGVATLNLGGEAATPMAFQTYQFGLLYAPRIAAFGWSPAAVVTYEGGLKQQMAARAVLSYDVAVAPLVGSTIDRMNFAGNLLAENDLQLDRLTYGYSLAFSYPVLEAPQNTISDPTDVRELQRNAQSPLRLGFEAKGKFDPGQPQYLIPAVYAQPTEALQFGVGVGLKVAGEGNPIYTKLNLQFQW